MHDVIIIGSGPAGCTAAIFSVRRNLRTLVLSDPSALSQAEEATLVDDWPGDPGIKGMDLVERFRSHARKLGAEILDDKVTDIKAGKKSVTVYAGKKSFEARTLIITTGARHRKGLVKGEDTFSGRGVSYCASCDAPLYRGRKVMVLGGGDTAVMYAMLLEQVGAETTLVHRRSELRAAEALQKKLFKSKVKVLWDTVCLEIKGGKSVASVTLLNSKTQKKTEMPVDGVFVALGTVPTSELARKAGVRSDESGFIITDRNQRTNVPNIFAAGDCCTNPTKKIVTAAGDGAVAAESAYNFIKGGE
jgi:thioredoxin reductase (NADPH)